MATKKPGCSLVSFFVLCFTLSSFSKPLHEANSFVSWLKRLEGGLRNKILSNGGCEACKVLTFLAQAAFLTNDAENAVVHESRVVCEELKIEDNRVCTEVIAEFKTEVLTVVDKVFLSPTEVCGSLLGPTCAHKRDPSGFWNVTIPEKKPPVKPIPPPKVCTEKFYFSDKEYIFQYYIILLFVESSVSLTTCKSGDPNLEFKSCDLVCVCSNYATCCRSPQSYISSF